MNRQERRKLEQATAKTNNGKTGKHIDLSNLRKKANGEVFTPPKLVEEMLNKYPKDDFSKKEFKWLDPCCGATVVFPIMIMFRLADGLRTSIPNPRERIKHIINNMLHMCEINEDAVNFGSAILSTYAMMLSVYLEINDSSEYVDKVRMNYVEGYEEMIEAFYEEVSKKGA